MNTKFKWLPPALKQYADETLLAPLPRGRASLVYRNLPKFLDQDEVEGQQHIVFVAYYPYAAIARKSIILRENGNCYTTLIACCVREDSESLRFFDQVYEVNDYQELLTILESTGAKAINLTIHPWIFGVLGIETKLKNNTRVVIDVNDSYLFIAKNSDILECQFEKEILRKANAFVHKMPGKAIAELRDTWQLDTPDYLVHSLPLKGLFRDSAYYDCKHKAKLVFAGGLMPPAIAKKRGHENHLFHRLIKMLPYDKIEFSIYLNKTSRNFFLEEYDDYFRLDRENQHFTFREGVPLYKLAEEISGYHFGLYYENFNASSYNPKHFQYNMATKFFSYLEAGLPVLVHSKAAYMKSYVEQHQLGIVYDQDKLDQVPALIKNSDHSLLKSKVDEFRCANKMTQNLPELQEAYGC
jgi:hypothetical protein